MSAPQKVTWKHFPTNPESQHSTMEGYIGRKLFAIVVFSSPVECTVGPTDNLVKLTNNAARVKELCLSAYNITHNTSYSDQS